MPIRKLPTKKKSQLENPQSKVWGHNKRRKTAGDIQRCGRWTGNPRGGGRGRVRRRCKETSPHNRQPRVSRPAGWPTDRVKIQSQEAEWPDARNLYQPNRLFPSNSQTRSLGRSHLQLLGMLKTTNDAAHRYQLKIHQNYIEILMYFHLISIRSARNFLKQ